MAATAHRPSFLHAVPATALFAGSVMLLVLGLLSITVYEEPAFKLVAMMAATVLGPDVLHRASDADARFRRVAVAGQPREQR